MTALRRISVVGLVAILLGSLAAPQPASATTSAADTYYVVTYFATPHKAQVVGVRWSGCGEPDGGWGGTSSHFTISRPACP